MRKSIHELICDRSGASAAEYALIVAVLGSFVVAGAAALGGGVKASLITEGGALNTVTGPTLPAN